MAKSSKVATRGKTTKDAAAEGDAKSSEANKKTVVISDHLPPFFLVLTVLACSGFLFVYAFRDVFATGRNIGGIHDEAYLVSQSSSFIVGTMSSRDYGIPRL